jgi:hypothetical protein
MDTNSYTWDISWIYTKRDKDGKTAVFGDERWAWGSYYRPCPPPITNGIGDCFLKRINKPFKPPLAFSLTVPTIQRFIVQSDHHLPGGVLCAVNTCGVLSDSFGG